MKENETLQDISTTVLMSQGTTVPTNISNCTVLYGTPPYITDDDFNATKFQRPEPTQDKNLKTQRT
ncbi:hypothetical protein E2C01_011291 [Portunus trituberculatus]|uniref:Uncharacterized protein n=1 Tax=Portunus trituberculatus TaxID=210409 RepID=A0A5B7DB13_PORTR|nr:hypothetical protein [Portunus trituberculatus]